MELAKQILEGIMCVWSFWGAAREHIDQHRKLEENVNDLRRKVNDLNARKRSVELTKKAEVRCRKKVKQEVDSWLEDVERVTTEVKKIEEEAQVVPFFSRARLGKHVCQKIDEAKEICQLGSFPQGVAVDAPPDIGVTILTTSLEGETDVKDQIWKYLMGDEVGMIGVCEMGGIGKTTIMKHIHNLALEERDRFEKVIWVTVSNDCNIFKIQEDIAKSMKVGFFPTDELERAAILKGTLEGKGFLLILDDVWSWFRLLDVGIPAPTSGKVRKIVLTSRSKEVCKSLGCEVITVKPLSKEESMNLFLDNVGQSVLQNQELDDIVNKIVEQCAGLPLAIVTIACSMKGVDDISEWRNALNELRERVKSVKGSDIKIFEQLKFSYDRLGDPNIQNCFLYCSLYPEDYEILKSKLIENWIDEGFLDGLTTRQAMHVRGHSILNKLKNNCLLERGIVDDVDDVERTIKMHDVLRDMALYIKSNGPQFMVKAGMQLKELPSEYEWTETLEKVSLMNNSITENIPLHMKPRCPRLSTLLMQQDRLTRSIPPSFFEHMPRLTVLNISYSRILVLPDSIFKLKTLNSLILVGCRKLTYLPSLEELKALKKLDLLDTGIQKFPLGIDKLENLTYFRLRSDHLKVLPVGILPNMSDHLQCLILYLPVTGKEVGILRRLEILSCIFPDLHEFETYAESIQGKLPTNFNFQVGLRRGLYLFNLDRLDNLNELQREVTFTCIMMEKVNHAVVSNGLQSVVIENSHDFKSFHQIPCFHKTTELKRCKIKSCEGIECVVDLSSMSSNPFQKIEELSLKELDNLLEIVRGVAVAVESSSHAPTPPAIFSSLKHVFIYNCSRMKKLFQIKLLQGLQSIEHIDVEDCEKMEEIIASEEEDEGTTVVLPKLKSLLFLNLPKLKKICSCRVMINAVSLECIEISDCPEVKRIPLALPLLENGETCAPPSLNGIGVYPREWWESLEWDQSDAELVLAPFVHFMLE